MPAASFVAKSLQILFISSALIFGPKVIFFTALILVHCAITMMVALTRGYGQPPL